MSSEATQTIGIYDVLAWLEANKQSVIIAFLAAVVIGFGVATYRWKSEQTELAASDALLKLKTSLGPSETIPVPEASAYEKVAQEFAGTAAGERALLMAGGALFTENKYAEAQAEFSKFVRERPQSLFAATAAYGVAASLEALGKSDEALVAYQNLSVRHPNSSVLEDAKLAIARIYEAKNQPEIALRTYNEIAKSTSSGGMSTAASEAMLRKEELLAKHPDLAKTNAPAAPSSNPVGSLTNRVPASATTNPATPKP